VKRIEPLAVAAVLSTDELTDVPLERTVTNLVAVVCTHEDGELSVKERAESA